MVGRALGVHALEAGGEAAWQDVLLRAPNATLFHDLGFLAYHPPGRLNFHHLVIDDGGRPVAVVPGGLLTEDSRRIWRSPVGASFGGPALATHRRLEDVSAVIEAIQAHARREAWARVEMVVPPNAYDPHFGDMVSFSLFRLGFREDRRWLCPMIPLDPVPEEQLASGAVFERRQVQAFRSGVRAGVRASEAGYGALGEFQGLFDETYARLSATASHTIDEIATLVRRFPDRVRFVIARQGDTPTAGLLVMRLTPHVAVTTYICSSELGLKTSSTVVAVAWLLGHLRRDGYRWLDLGPSADDRAINTGVMLFKEGLGGIGYVRSLWSWSPS